MVSGYGRAIPRSFKRAGLQVFGQLVCSWLDCQTFILILNDNEVEQRLGLSGIWRLPTVEEWEYACRAGSTTRWYHSDRDKDLDEVAWHAGNSGATTREVGKKRISGAYMIVMATLQSGQTQKKVKSESRKVVLG